MSPLRNPASAYVGASGSHKRSRQSLEVDRFLNELASSPLQRRYGVSSSPAPAAAAAAAAAAAKQQHQQPAAQFSLDGAPLLDDESEAEQEEHKHVGGERASSRAKLFHTPSAATPRAVFTSPSADGYAVCGAGFSALDVGAALDAASGDATYLRPRLSFSALPLPGAPAASSSSTAGNSSLAAKVQSELRASSKLNELMQQLEYRFGGAV